MYVEIGLNASIYTARMLYFLAMRAKCEFEYRRAAAAGFAAGFLERQRDSEAGRQRRNQPGGAAAAADNDLAELQRMGASNHVSLLRRDRYSCKYH